MAGEAGNRAAAVRLRQWKRQADLPGPPDISLLELPAVEDDLGEESDLSL